MEKNYLELSGNVYLAQYIRAAEVLGIDYKILKKGLLAEFFSGNKSWYVMNAVTPLNSNIARTLAKRKNLGTFILQKEGIPTAVQKTLNSTDDAVNFYNEYKEIVIKPVQNYGGRGVSILPQNEQEVIEAYEDAYANDQGVTVKSVIGETFARGTNYRFLVLGDKVIGIVHRLPATITGDGQSTISQLIEKKNEGRATSVLPAIPMDRQFNLMLKVNNLTPDSILGEGERIPVRFNSNLSTGGSVEECANIAHEYFKELAVKASRALKLELSGVDFIIEDITDPNSSHIINEVNANPGLRVHYNVDAGEVVDVALDIMKHMADHL